MASSSESRSSSALPFFHSRSIAWSSICITALYHPGASPRQWAMDGTYGVLARSLDISNWAAVEMSVPWKSQNDFHRTLEISDQHERFPHFTQPILVSNKRTKPTRRHVPD